MNFDFTKNEFAGMVIIAPRIFSDERGHFYESYKISDFQKNGISDNFVQDNFSYSHRGVVRGLHFQAAGKEQAKLVHCLSGEIYDVVVDLRKSSPTFKKCFGIILSEKNNLILYVPKGFAHGFATLSETAKISYKVSAEYDPKSEFGIRWNDPDLAIDWRVKSPVISAKDQILPLLKDSKIFF